MRKKQRLAIYGGTFDPIHMGHLLIAETSRTLLGLDRVYFLPAFSPPHKDFKGDSARARLDMLELAIQDNPHFAIDYREIESGKVRYSVDTVKEIQKENPDHEICFIVGEDSLMDIGTWHRPEDLLSRVHLVVATRMGIKGDPEKKAEALRRQGYQITLFSRFITGLSSTEIRREVKAGRSIHYAVPEKVEKYILERGLYLGE